MAIDIVAKLRLIDQASRPLRSALSSFTKLGAAAAGIGAAVGGIAVVTDSVKKAMDFESQMASIKALTDATEAQMKQMTALALEQGAATKYSALEAAQGIEELLKAGMTTADVQNGGLAAALNLAAAGGLELSEAAETMATSMNAFKKDALKANQVADILAGTANAAATDVRGIGFAIASAGGVADMAGVSFRDLNAAIGLMSNDGLKNGSDAGTSFKSMLMYLQPQTKKATEMFEKLGIGVGKANKFFKNGKIRGLADIAQVLQDITKGMTDQERTATFLDIFGTDGVKAATSLYKAGAKGVKEFYSAMSTTTALKVAQEKMNTAAGAVEQFQGAVETLQISALRPTLPLIQDFANAAGDFVTKYTPQITAAMERMVNKAKNYLSTHFTNNPEFQKIPTIEGKIKFVFDEFSNSLKQWLDNGGSAQIQAAGEAITNLILNSLETYGPRISDLMVTIGKDAIGSFFKGMVESFNLYHADNPLDRWWASYYDKKYGEGYYGSKTGIYYDENGKPQKYVKPPTGTTPGGNDYSGANGSFGNAKSHSAGLDRVPFNGYAARLHKDEMVLTRGEAQAYRDSGGSGGRPVTINLGGVTINNDTDIDALCEKLAQALASA